jgi:hypothetical protein
MPTSKERFTAAAEHRISDRVPVAEHWVPHTLIEQILGVERSLYNAWGHTRIAYWEGRRDDVVADMKRHYVEFIRRTGLDAASVQLVPPRNWELHGPRRLGDDTWEDATGARLRWFENVHDIEVVEPGTKPAKAPEYPDPDGTEWEFWDHVVAELGDTHFILAMAPPLRPPDPCRIHLGTSRFDVFEALMLRIKEAPESIAAAQIQSADAIYNGAVRARGRGADAVRLCFDYGCNTGPYCSPSDFRRAYLPGLKAQVDAVHRAGLKVVLHVDGSLEPLIDQIAEAGPDVYQAIQSFEPVDRYKRATGDRLAFWGNIDNDRLARGTPEEIRAAAERAVALYGNGGGFILGSSHDILLPTPQENFMAMVKAALDPRA